MAFKSVVRRRLIRRMVTSAIVLAALPAAFVGIRAQITRNPLRSVSGAVTDGSREPLRGAVVQIEAEDTLVIQSYVTDERGTYHFRNLRPDADYRVWATFRGQRSKTQEMSKFDRKPDREISLSIELGKD
ncbi:carboxypeptidase-like regulatory domain-containing protein [Terriglobus roseus]|uniref:Carboxypeptidase regulatory-like domain-containing protein n=1 Tax=Terriglobus roseus TaxID=392734 RepID=A0A1G7NXW9_9BACT|nr:carboxypeptidase-like regulatory domain-containing protein [Terriglobus roseus]SDF78050.1 Carboxypeptidase regulatory-like domain-containing protein [Terriglobus roseus]